MAEVKDYSAEALLAKEKEVELDTDNVKEESVQLEEKSETTKEPNLNLGEVDLGYTDHSKPKEEKSDKPDIQIAEEKTEEPKQEAKEETKEEKPNLQESRRDYQKRIDKLVFQKKEAERREKAAIDFAKGLQKKYDQTSLKFKESDEQYLKEFDARVDAQREQVKVALKQAIESNDASQIMEANDKLTQLAVEKEKARLELSNREKQKRYKHEFGEDHMESRIIHIHYDNEIHHGVYRIEDLEELEKIVKEKAVDY